MKRYEKENKVLEFLDSMKQYSEPIRLTKHYLVCNPSLFAELYSNRIKQAPTQEIYNSAIDKVAYIKRLIDEKEA